MTRLDFIVPEKPAAKSKPSRWAKRGQAPFPQTTAVLSVVALTITIAAAGTTLAITQGGFDPVQEIHSRTLASVSLQRPPPAQTKAAATPQHPQVIGISTTRIQKTPPPKKPLAPKKITTAAVVTPTQVQNLIAQSLQTMLAQGLLTGPQGPAGPQGPPGLASSGLVNNGNGQTTPVIGGQPIVSYYPPVVPNNLSGTSLAGFGTLSAGTFTSGNSTINGSLNVSGATTLTGDFNVTGTTSLATTTLSTLTVSGPTTLTGSTTIAGLTVTGLNPGLTQGSVTFQGASALAQDNANFFYDSINHRLGVGTSTPTQLLTVAGNALFTGNATTSGNQVIGGTLSVISTSTLASTTAASLTVSGGSLLSTLSVTGQTTLTSASATALTVSGPSALTGTTTLATTSIASLMVNGNSISGGNSGDVTLAGQNYLSLTGQQITASAIGLTGSNVSGILNVANGGTGASALTAFDLLLGNGTSAVATITPGTVFQVLRSAGAAANPTYSDIGSLLTAGSNISVTGTSTLAVSSTSSFTTLTVTATSTLATITATSLTTTGNIGIGTTSPSQLLTVGNNNQFTVTSAGAATAGSVLSSTFLQSNSYVQVGSTLYLTTGQRSTISSPSNGNIELGNNALTDFNLLQFGGTTSSYAGLQSASSTASGGIALKVVGADGAANENLYVTGNVGIGTTGPVSTLAVNGSGYFNGNIALADTISSGVGSLTVGGTTFLSDYPGTIGTNGDVWVGDAGNYSLTGIHNTGVGYQAMPAETSGGANTALGYQAMDSNTTGGSNTVVGYYSLHSNTSNSFDTIVGSDAAQLMTADGNTCVGNECLQLTTTGAYNTAIGEGAMQDNTTGFETVAIGEGTLWTAHLAASDVAIGGEAAEYAVEANNNDSNTAIGEHSLYQATNESYNMCLGRASCYNLTTGNGNINIGGFEATMFVPSDGWTLTLAFGSGLTVGTYAYKIAWTLNGQNTELSQYLGNTITTTSGNQQVTIGSLPAYSGPLTCTQTLIYRTKVGFATGNQRWYLDHTMGNCAGGSYTDSVADGSLGAEDASPNNTLVMGYMPNSGDQTAYKSNQAVFGAPSNPYTEFWLGSGVFTPTSTPVLISSAGGSGTNTPGSNLIIQGGPGTGSGNGGSISFVVAPVGSSGSTWNATSTAMVISSTGNVGIGTTTPNQPLTVYGNLSVATSSTPALLVNTATGNVGIGTTGPGKNLDVGAGDTGYTIRVNTTNGSYGGFNLAAAGTEKWNIGFAALNNDNLIFRGAGSTNVMALTTSGNVGIGTTSPATSLEVDGSGFQQGQITGTSNTGSAGLYLSNSTPRTLAIEVEGTSTAGTIFNNQAVIYGRDSLTKINIAANRTGSPVATFDLSAGYVGIGTSTPTLGPLTMASGAYVSAGGTWTNASDRNLKENFATVSPADILQKIDQLPVTEWDYKKEGPTVKHIGPIAQDFWALFQLGNSSTSISTIDPGGIAFLGIQALDQKITALQGGLTGNATATNLTVYSPSNFSGDSVGQAEILTGQTSVRVTFTQAYQYQPIVTADILNAFIEHNISDVTANGFSINIPAATTTDITFNWHSFASPNEQLSVSDGTTAPLPVISSPDATTAAVSSSSTPDASASTTADNISSSSTTAPQVLGAATSTPETTPAADSAGQPDPAPAAIASSTPVAITPEPSPATTATSTAGQPIDLAP